VYWLKGEAEAARKLAEQALPMARSSANERNLAEALLNLSFMMVFQKDDYDRARAYQEEAKRICQEAHDDWNLARAYVHMGATQSRRKEYEAARSLYDQSFKLYKKLGDINFQGNVMHFIGSLEVEHNNWQDGVEFLRESLKINRLVNGKLYAAGNIFKLARVARLNGNHPRAVRLYLAGQGIFEDLGVWGSDEDDASELEEALETARAELDDAEFQLAWNAGQNMTMEEAIEYALSD